MKKLICVILSSVFVFMFASSCAKQPAVNQNTTAGASSSSENGLTGTWTVETPEISEKIDPMINALAKVLEGYLKSAATIEFKDGGTAVLGGKEIKYTFENNKLTLIFNDSQKFTLDAVQSGDKLELSYQGYLSFALIKVK